MLGTRRLFAAPVRRSWWDVAGIGSILAFALAYLSPALKDGVGFGSFDLVVRLTSLGADAYPGPAYNHLNSDVVSQSNAWLALSWRQIHAGHFPLWNGLSLFGLPHFLNFESAVLGLPSLVSYAVPLKDAFIVSVLVTLLIAGTGAYVLARVVGLTPFGASFAGVSFMLSGAFANWLSWSLSDVLAWLGWIAALALLCCHRPVRFGYVVGLALSVAFCLYGGFPEANAFVAVALVLMAVVFVSMVSVAALGARRRREATPADDRRRIWAVLAGPTSVVGAIIAGTLLALPLWWPGLQVLSSSHRQVEGGFPGIPVQGLALLATQGYFGLPIKNDAFFLAGSNYYETVAYVGIVVLVLALVAVVLHWRHPAVLAALLLTVAVVVVCYQTSSFHPVQDFLSRIAGEIEWSRFRSVVGLPLGLLGGIGLETVWRRRQSVRTWAVFSAATLLAAVAVVFLAMHEVSGPNRAVRERSLIWPAALVGFCVVCALGWALALAVRRQSGKHSRRAGRLAPRFGGLLAPSGLWAASAAFLLFAGVGINSYAKSPFKPDPAIEELQHYVGHSLVGVDTGKPKLVQVFVHVGFYPETNLGYGIDQFAGHDPVIPESYFAVLSPTVAPGGPGLVQPDIHTVAIARKYGTRYILVLKGLIPPKGTRRVADIAGEGLYYVPGAARFTLTAGGRVARVNQPSPSQYVIHTMSRRGGTLTARVTDLPGWHASIDGHPVRLVSKDKIMWSLHVPAGSHEVRLWYWPGRLSEGIVAAIAGGAGLVAWGATALWWRRRRSASNRAGGPAGAQS